MATNKFKSVMVNPSYELEFPSPQEFVRVNNIATFGSDVDAEFKNIASYGTLGFGTDTGKISFWGIMQLGINTSDGAPYGVIDMTSGIGLKLPNNILGTGLSFYKNTGEAIGGLPFASINSSGITSTGSLIIENTNGGIGWEFKNGTIRNWNAYCDSEIKTNNVLEDGGIGYSTIDLIAKKYSEGNLTDSISIGLNGSTKTVKVSDNATVQLPANTTIGGNTPATFGDDVDAVFDTVQANSKLQINGYNGPALIITSRGEDGYAEFEDNGYGIKFKGYDCNSELMKLGINKTLPIQVIGDSFDVDTNSVILPANTTIGGNTPATFGEDVDAEFRNLTTHGPITVYGVENALTVDGGPNSMPMLTLTGPVGIKFNSPIYENIELYGFNAETEESYSVFNVNQDTLRYSGNKSILPLNTQIGSGAVSVSFSGDENNGFIQLTTNALEFALPGYSYRIDDNSIKLKSVNPEIGTTYIYLNNEASGNVDISAAGAVYIGANLIDLIGNVTINGKTAATFGDTVSGILKDLTFTDGIIIDKNKLSAGGEYGSAITFNDAALNIAGYDSVYINGFSSGVTINSEGGEISLNSNHNKIDASSSVGIELTAPEVKISDTFTIPVYTVDNSGNYTKVVNETKTVRCVKQVLSDGTATYTLELA